MKKVKVLIIALMAMAGLLVAVPVANAATQSGGLQGVYFFVAPGQTLNSAIPPGVNPSLVSCIFNADNANYNVGIGFGINGSPANSYNTYQGIVLRKWLYCSAGTVARQHSLIVGNGFCMDWHKYARLYLTTGQVQPYGVEVASGNVQGSALTGNVFRLSSGYSYAFSQYYC